VLIDGKPFDHSRTRYPLEGKHRSVGCTECHRGGIAKTPRPTFATCTACHQDTHGGQATLAGKPADCGACHTVAGYLPATYTAQRHAESGYPLQGKHAAVGCRDCHPKRPENKALGTAAIVIRRPHERCVDCHKDAHAGQFAAATGERAVFADCAACHRVDGFKPSTFDLARHAKTRLPLQGKHATTTCAACHGPQRTDLPALPDKSKLGPAGVLLTLSDAACAACHRDPHAARFKQACSECHDQNRFRPSTYDLAAHARCSFKLDGAHRAVPCAECHVDLKREPTRATLLLTRTTEPPLLQPLNKTLCSDCHESPHGVQFEGRARGEACTVCHQDGSFKPASRFDHDRHADFKLRGAHEKVLCSACHVPRIEAGRAVVVYHPVPAHCEDCHRKSPKGKLP
jgi:hypothetical protein